MLEMRKWAAEVQKLSAMLKMPPIPLKHCFYSFQWENMLNEMERACRCI